jgi:hypothetical protein
MTMDNSTLLVVIVIVAIALWIVLRVNKARRQADLIAQAQQFVRSAEENKKLGAVSTRIVLRRKETAYYSDAATLYETRAVRHYESSHTGMKIAKGLYIGGSSGRSASTQEWTGIATGTLTITNQRLVFVGDKEERVVPISKIVATDIVRTNDGPTRVEVSVEGRQKNMMFTADNPFILATIIRICCQVADPSDLSKDTITLKITA